MIFRGRMLALPLLVVCLSPAQAASLDPASATAPSVKHASRPWDKQAAAKYLDDRMDLWFEHARKLRTGQGTTACASCHITVPYALARPALRQAEGVNQPTPQEARMLEETLRRVETYGSHEPMTPGEEEESRGTEAVLNVFVLVGEDARQYRLAPSEPTRKALDELWKTQRGDGAWNWLNTGLEPYESADGVYYGATLVAMAVGNAPDYVAGAANNASRGIAKLRSYLKTAYADQSLYNQAWMLLASTRMADLLSREQTDALTAELVRAQNVDGGWSLYKLGPWRWSKPSPPYGPKGKPDLGLLSESDAYGTGLIAYSLRKAGLPAGHASLRRARDWLEANQREWQIGENHWQCWRTYSLNVDHEHGGPEGGAWRRMFMSDAATAFAAMALLATD
jgi:squalene-hopene/tetraprenyl-beta-curcumene cyclase